MAVDRETWPEEAQCTDCGGTRVSSGAPDGRGSCMCEPSSIGRVLPLAPDPEDGATGLPSDPPSPRFIQVGDEPDRPYELGQVPVAHQPSIRTLDVIPQPPLTPALG